MTALLRQAVDAGRFLLIGSASSPTHGASGAGLPFSAGLRAWSSRSYSHAAFRMSAMVPLLLAQSVALECESVMCVPCFRPRRTPRPTARSAECEWNGRPLTRTSSLPWSRRAASVLSSPPEPTHVRKSATKAPHAPELPHVAAGLSSAQTWSSDMHGDHHNPLFPAHVPVEAIRVDFLAIAPPQHSNHASSTRSAWWRSNRALPSS